MDTQLFNQSPNNPGNKKSGKGGMSTGAKAGIGAAAGIAAGAGVAVAADHIVNQPDESKPDDENQEQNPEEAQKADGKEAPKAQDAPKPAQHDAHHQPQHHTNEAHHQPQQHEPKHSDDVTNRGADDNGNHTETTVTNDEHHTDSPVKPEENTVTTPEHTVDNVTPDNPVDINAPVNPDENVPDIAQVEIDEDDYDGTPMLDFDDVGTVYGVDGSEVNVAHMIAEDGSDYMTADIDGDGIFDGIIANGEVAYSNGEFTGQVENVYQSDIVGTMADAQDDIDTSGGYIAATEPEPDLSEDFGEDVFEA